MPPSKLDSIYRRLLRTRFFDKGWGKPENLQRIFEFRKYISRREMCYPLIPFDYPVEITHEHKYQECSVLEGKFRTPLEFFLPGVMPAEVQQAHFQVVLPNKWNDENHKPICIHLAGTGDHYFWRRRNFIAKPLLKQANIGAIILENPFYGLRKPHAQVNSNLQNVSDIFVMGGCLMLECLVLLHWCERNGFGPLGITGLSMGGHMASLAATNWPKPLVLVPCLSWSTAAAVFTTGVMSESINWKILETQYFSECKYRDSLSKMVTVIDDAFMAGQNFIKDFKQSLRELEKDIKDTTLIDNTPIAADDINNKIATMNTTTTVVPIENSSTLTQLMNSILPQSAKIGNDKVITNKANWWEREALQFMRGMMDECTHLKNFSVPYDTSLIIAVCAKDDGYVPREGCSSLEDIWPGAEVRYVDAGHVSAYVLHQRLFRSCIIEAFERAKKQRNESNNNENLGEDLKPTLTYEDLMQKYAGS